MVYCTVLIRDKKKQLGKSRIVFASYVESESFILSWLNKWIGNIIYVGSKR